MSDDSIAETTLLDGREAMIYPLLFGRARLVVGAAGSPFYDESW